MNKGRFIKLMMMTTSDMDGEALTALRMANAMLAEDNLNWEEFCNGKDQQQRQYTAHTDIDNIDKMFAVLFDTVPATDGFREFIESVHAFWERTGRLTPRQYDAIKRAYDRRRR
jgi:hypothetical protein